MYMFSVHTSVTLLSLTMKRVDPTGNAAKADLGPEVRGQGSSLWWAGQPWFCVGLFSPQQGSSVALASAWLFAHCTMLWMDSTSKVLPDQLSYASELVIFFKLIQMALLFPFCILCFSCANTCCIKLFL